MAAKKTVEKDDMLGGAAKQVLMDSSVCIVHNVVKSMLVVN